MSQNSFNVLRACFWLVAFVIGAHVMAALAAEATCIFYSEAIVSGKFSCESISNRLTEVLAAALAATLAFAGGRAYEPTKPPVEPNPDDPDGV